MVKRVKFAIAATLICLGALPNPIIDAIYFCVKSLF
jgi:hypothetical protein